MMPIRLPLPDGLTHHETLICMWLASDPPLLEQTRLLIADDPDNPVPYDYVILSSFVFELLYDPLYSHFPQKDLWRVMQNCGDMATARNLRISVPMRALYAIEEEGWDRIRTALLAEPCGNCKGSGLDPRYNGEHVCPDCAVAKVFDTVPDSSYANSAHELCGDGCDVTEAFDAPE